MQCDRFKWNMVVKDDRKCSVEDCEITFKRDRFVCIKSGGHNVTIINGQSSLVMRDSVSIKQAPLSH